MATTEKFKFVYQEQEQIFLETHYSSYLHYRGMTENDRICLVSGYIKCIPLQFTNSQDFNFNHIEHIITQYFFCKPNKKQKDELYKMECKQIENTFRKFREQYMKSITEPKKTGRFNQPMTEWESKYEECNLIIDNKHVFNIDKSIDAYFDYKLRRHTNLMPHGPFMLIAPNKLEYILPGDKIFCYILHGGYRRKRPKGRWYFWTR
eukprot:312972_1